MTPAGHDEARRMRRVLVGCLVGLTVFVVHCRGTLTCFDSMWRVPSAISIWD